VWTCWRLSAVRAPCTHSLLSHPLSPSLLPFILRVDYCSQILANFGVDVLEALSGTCTLYTQSNIGLMQLLSDMLVAFLLITAHGSVLMCQVGLGSEGCRV
jgi:hypothetical protein